MKKSVRNIVVTIILFVFCLGFSLGLSFAGENAVKDTAVLVKDFSGTEVNAVSVYDVKGVMKMTAFNYIPDDFAELNEVVSGENTGSSPSKRGTYRFCIDTLNGDQWKDTEKLQGLLKPDGNWHLTMYIPPVFSACSVYVRYQNKEYVGSIERYNVNYYGSFSAPSKYDDSVAHKTATKPIFIDIPVSSDSKYSKECIVTIHYEADNDNFVGLSDRILIGEDSAVREAVEDNRSLLLTGAIIGATTLLLFVFICLLKRSVSFIPQLLSAVGVFIALISSYTMFGTVSAPYFVIGIRRFSVALMLFASALYLPKKASRIRVLPAALAVAAVTGAAAFISPLCTTTTAYDVLRVIYTISALVLIAVVVAFTVCDVAKSKPIGLRLNGVIASALAITVLFIGQSFPFTALSPAFWLCLSMLGITVVLGFREFISAEIHNRYLTNNLQKEVARETGNLKTVLAERDKILLYVSHDMKKTVAGMGGELIDLKQNLSQPELIAKVDCLLQKNDELKKDFANLGKYNRQNYVAEQSEVMDLCALVNKVTDELRPDCEANGIVLVVTLPERLDVYAKKVALESVVLNLVLNAIEHSSCSRLEVSAVKRKDECLLSVVDDGTGVTTDKNIFEPYVSGDRSENNSGLGLFLAKTAVESMHGTLTYERKDNLTVFSATLPLA